MLKLYDYSGAPNPKRVKIFAAEKGIDLELIHCDLLKGEQKSPAFLEKNSSGKIPVLELPNGRCIPEAISICRYLESIQPEPNLFGIDIYERAFVDARERQIELEFWREVGTSWVNGPIIAKMGIVKPNLEAKYASDQKVKAYFDRLDSEFSNTAYVAGDRFTVADITLWVAVEFGASFVGLTPSPELKNLARWNSDVSVRESVLVNAGSDMLKGAFNSH